MIVTTRYIVEWENGADTFRVRNLNAPLCPSCGFLCSGYDTRSRRVISGDGKATVYRLRRVRCPHCDKLHLEMPDFICPRKHYAANVVSGVLAGESTDCPADESTMRRWRKNHLPGLPVPP